LLHNYLIASVEEDLDLVVAYLEEVGLSLASFLEEGAFLSLVVVLLVLVAFPYLVEAFLEAFPSLVAYLVAFLEAYLSLVAFLVAYLEVAFLSLEVEDLVLGMVALDHLGQ
jgi:hypothetical protein